MVRHDDYLPRFVLITEAKRSDVKMADAFTLNPGSIVAMDRGYNGYGLFGQWTAKEIYFVTRLKKNAVYEVVEECAVPKDRNIRSDQLIRFTGVQAQKDCPCLLRRVVVWDAVDQREIVLLTNMLAFGATTTIAAIYKDRWEIELFFKAFKQNLKVNSFVGTSENALAYPDLDSLDRDSGAEMAAPSVESKMVPVQSSLDAAAEPVYLS